MTLRDLFLLDPDVLYLNHGSYGACPRAVLEAQTARRERIEREPVDFYSRDLAGLLGETRGALAAFVGANTDDLVFVPNTTTAVATVLASLRLSPGDELLTTNHAYAACRKALAAAAERTGARVVTAKIPFPLEREDEIVEPILAACTNRTRLALLDHVTSPTAIVFPIARLVRELRARGVETLVDGAHALGMVPLHLDEVGAAYTAGNAHKWLCAPKGAAFLHVRRDLQQAIHPLVVSHGWGGGFRAEFDWQGTADPTPFLAIPECLRFLGGLLPGGSTELMERNRALALAARDVVAKGLGMGTPCPAEWIGSMASIPLPSASPNSPAARLDAERLATWCRERGVETWFHAWDAPGGKVVRVSAQAYNELPEYERLASLLLEALRDG